MIAQRGRREFVLRRLESRYVKNAGQGGGGQLADRELQQAILGRGAATLAWGSVVHSDGCKTYSNLNSTPVDTLEMGAEAEARRELAEGEWMALQLDEMLAARRLETPAEAEHRRFCEWRCRPRSAEIARRYEFLCLSTTMVLHSKKKDQRVQYSGVRRVVLHPEVAAHVAAAGTDPFLEGCVTWRKGGTQRPDGHWKDLRAGVASRGYNARNASELDHCVRVHQWAYWAGPGKCLFTELGRLVRRVRVRRAQHVAAARAEDRAQRAQQWLQQVIGRART